MSEDSEKVTGSKGEWQDIASAPKDGTVFVGHDADTKTSHVTWWEVTLRRWYDPDNHYYSETEPFEPSHWLPLPTPPETNA